MPGIYNTKLYIGDNWQRTVVIRDPAGAPVDLTGCAAKWQVRAEPTAITPLIAMGTATGEITISGSTLTASLSGAVTTALAPGTYVHDLEVTAGGVVTSYLAGCVVVIQDVSR